MAVLMTDIKDNLQAEKRASDLSVELHRLRTELSRLSSHSEQLARQVAFELEKRIVEMREPIGGIDDLAASEVDTARRKTTSAEAASVPHRISKLERGLWVLQTVAAVIGAAAAFFYLMPILADRDLSAYWNAISLGVAFFCLGLGGAYLVFTWYQSRQAHRLKQEYACLQARADSLSERIASAGERRLHGT